MDIRNYFAILTRRIWIILLTTAVTVATAALVSSLMTPIYAARATLRLATGESGGVDYGDYIYAERLLNTYAQLILTEPILGPVRERLGLNVLPKVKVEVVSNTELMRIIAEDPDPLVAQYVANALADELQKQSRDFYRASAVSIIEPASRPWVPSSPRKNLNIMMGALVGVTAGLGLALLFENLDSTLHTAEDMKSAAYPPILGRIPATRKVKRNNRLAFSSNGFSIEHESFRRLRTNVLALSPEQRLKTLMATSAERGEGKSTVIANLAVTFAEAGCQVVLVDADLRLPSLQKIFDLPNEIGCTNVLFQEISPDEAVQSSKVAGLHVLTSGPQTEKPAELLGSAQMVQLIGHLSQQFDIVLIDTPCLLSVADPGVLAPLVDGVILIVSLGQTRRETVDAAFQQLADVKANTIGVIVNRAKKERSYYGTKYPPIKTRGN